MAGKKPDIELLFGVKGGGGTGSGSSGELIREQLTEIVKKIGEDQIKVKLGVDSSEGVKNAWAEQIKHLLDVAASDGKLSVQVSSITLAPRAIDDFRKQLAGVAGTLGLTAGAQINVRSKGVGEASASLKQVQGELKSTGTAAAETAKELSKVGDSAKSGAEKGKVSLREFTDIFTRIQDLLTKNPQMRGSESFADISGQVDTFRNILTACGSDAGKFGDALKQAGLDGADAIEAAKSAISSFKAELSGTKAEVGGESAFKRASEAAKEYYALLSRAGKTGGDISLTPDGYQSVSGKYDSLAQELNKAADAFGVFTSRAAKSKMSQNELANLAGFLEQKERDLALAVEDRAAKQESANKAGILPGDYTVRLREAQNLIRSIQADYDAITGNKGGVDYSGIKEQAQAVSAMVQDMETKLKALRSGADTGALNGLLQDLTTAKGLMDGLKESIDGPVKAVGELASQSKELSGLKDDLQDLSDSMKTFREINGTRKPVEGAAEEKKGIDDLIVQYEEWALKIKEVQDGKREADPKYLAGLKQEGTRIEETAKSYLKKAEAQEKDADAARHSAAENTKNSSIYKQVTEALTRVRKAQESWTAARGGKSASAYADLENYAKKLEQLRGSLAHLTPEEARSRLAELNAGFKSAAGEIQAAGENTATFTGRLGTLASKFTSWLTMSQLVMTGVNSIRNMIDVVIDLDDAMTQLKVVTQDTDEAYRNYLNSISQTATRIGATVPDLISSTTTYARLGYSLDESSKLAEYTAMLQNVGDIDVTDAQNAVTAIVKAFGMSVDEIESVMDKLVITGNRFPISASEIAEGMNNASSALAAAGNTFDQSVALMTAANATIQDAAKSSTGLRTIAARLRNTKTELDDLGEAMTVAEYDKLAQTLTDFNVALTDANGEFKSTYDIVAGIAAQWDNMTSMEQAAIADMAAGTRQQSVFFSLVEQFREASGAMDAMANSAGTLDQAYGTYMESTTAHLNQFKAAFQGLASDAIDTSAMNSIIDSGTELLNILSLLTPALNLVENAVAFFGPVASGGLVAFAVQMSKARNEVVGVSQVIVNLQNGIKESGFSAASAAEKMAGLSKAQMNAVSAALKLSDGQRDVIDSLLDQTAVVKDLTVADVQMVLKKEGLDLASKLNCSSTDKLTQKLLLQAVANGTLTEQEAVLLTVKKDDRMATEALSVSYDKLTVKQKLAAAAASISPLGWVTIALSVLPVVISLFGKLYDLAVTTPEEANEAAEQANQKFSEATRELEGLNRELETANDRIKELNAKDGKLSLVEERELEDLRESVKLLQIRKDLAEKAAEAEAKSAASANVEAYRKNYGSGLSETDVNRIVQENVSSGPDASLFLDHQDLPRVAAGIKLYEGLRDSVDEASEEYLNYQNIVDSATGILWKQVEVLSGYKDSLESVPYESLTADQKAALNEIRSSIEIAYRMFDPDQWQVMQWENVLNENGYRDTVNKLKDMAGEAALSASDVEGVVGSDVIGQWDALGISADYVARYFNDMAQSAEDAGEAVQQQAATMNGLKDAMAALSSGYDLLKTAQDEMANGQGLSAETIAKLAEANENYMDFLTVENGLVKLNTEAWLENTEAKMRSDMAAIQQEIAALEERNRLLRENQDDTYSTGTEDAQIEKNEAQIQALTDKLSLYQAVLDQTKTSANGAFQPMTEALSGLVGHYDTLTAAQKELNESGVLSASTLSSIASAYPDLQGSIDAYIAGMISAKDLLGQLSDAYGTDVDNYRNAMFEKLSKNEDFYNSLTDTQKQLIDALSKAYGIDLSNFQTVEQKKLEFQAQIIAKLAQNYSEYAGASLAGLEAELDSLGNSEADSRRIEALEDAIYAIKSYNQKMKEIASGEGLFKSFDPTEFKTREKSSGSSGSSSKTEAKGWLDTLNDLDSGVNSLSGALKELSDEGQVSTKTLAGLSGAFGKLKSFNTAINAMGKSGATMEEAQGACNALAEELIRTSGILDMVTEENAEVIASALEAMGVTNARTLVLKKFSAASAAAIAAENGLANAAWDQTAAFLRGQNVTEVEIEALRLLRSEQYNAALAAVDFSKANAEVTESLIRQAEAAGASAESIAALRKLQSYQRMGYAGAKANGFEGTEKAFQEFLKQLAEKARIDLSGIKIKSPDVNVNVEVESDGKSKDGEEDSEAKRLEVTYKAYEASVNRFAEATEKLRKSTEAINKATVNVEMEDNSKQKLERQLELLSANKQAIQDSEALMKEQADYIEKELLPMLQKEVGVTFSYDKASNSLVFPNQTDGQPVDKYVESDLEYRLLHILLGTGEATLTGHSAIDEPLKNVAKSFNGVKPSLDKLNEILGTQISYEDMLKDILVDQYAGNDSFKFYDWVKQANPNAFNANGTWKSDEESQAYRELAYGIKREIEQAFEEGAGKDFKTLLDKNVAFADYVTYGGLDDLENFRVEADMSGINAFKDALAEGAKNAIDEAIDLNKSNQQLSDDMLEKQKEIHDLWNDILDTIANVVEESNKAVDDLQSVYSTLKKGAQEFSESGGYISTDTFQEIMKLEPRYLQFLIDENGQWTINEERIRAVTAAKAEQLALDNAWAYVKRIELALQDDAIEKLDELLYATQAATDSTWESVYASLAAMDLTQSQYEAARHNIDVMRDLAVSAVNGIGIVADTASDSVGGLDDLINYVMEMLKQRLQDQVDTIEDMKDAYGELIEAKKESLQATRDEESYEKKRSKQLKEIAKLQARIDMLSLDSSREAQAEKKKLLEQMAELQEELSDTQSDYAIDNQEDALDKMQEAYEKEKDKEIDDLENTLSSKQKLWEKAIDYIKSYWGDNWDALREELLQWNYDVGSDLEKNLVSAWESATEAAGRYGDFVSALDAMKKPGIDGTTDGNAVANRNEYDMGIGQRPIFNEKEREISDSVTKMKANSRQWFHEDDDGKKKLEEENLYYAKKIEELIDKELDRIDGTWYLPDGRKLYDVYKGEYHTGGVVGGGGTLKDDEVLAKLQAGETVLTRKMWENAVEAVEKLTKLSNAISAAGPSGFTPGGGLLRSLELLRPNAVTNITNDARPVSIAFGDTIINGADPNAVEQHRAVSREMMNEIARWVRRP